MSQNHLPTFSCTIATAVTLGCLATLPSADAALNINLDFTDFSSGLPAGSTGTLSDILNNDSYTAATTDATRISDAEAMMNEAASMIEGMFSCVTTNIDYTIGVGWDPKDNTTLASGGASIFSSGPTLAGTGSLSWDSDGTSTFFVDTTPADASEFTAGSDQRTMNFTGSSMPLNVEDRYYAGFGTSAAQSHADMLSTAIHEIVHALGAGSTFNAIADIDSDGDFDLLAPQTTYEIPYDSGNVGHTNQSLPWNGPGNLSGGTYYPNVMGPANVQTTRGLLTDLDALMLTNALVNGGLLPASEIENIKYPFLTVAIPEPGSLLLFGLGSFTLLFKRRRQ